MILDLLSNAGPRCLTTEYRPLGNFLQGFKESLVNIGDVIQ